MGITNELLARLIWRLGWILIRWNFYHDINALFKDLNAWDEIGRTHGITDPKYLGGETRGEGEK